MKRPHVWIVEGRYGGLWLPIAGTATETRRCAREECAYRREFPFADAYRVRKYVREP